MTQVEDASLEQDLEERVRILLQDELLKDVPTNPRIEEIETLISVEQGRAYQITIDRSPLEPLSIAVRQSTTVSEIKKLIKAKLDRTLKTNEKKSISWKYIWRTYCLMLDGQRLTDDSAVVSQLGIKQGTVLKFSRMPHEKGTHRKAWRWYRK
ncbi:hypothetical protein VTP01DRAFT_7914 [Rhizomucor pusillus]|uniref:uncharacterized protein n=1 Tax=Rhizomucor pusillus TaxID=4840 RepID=UPI00374230DB